MSHGTTQHLPPFEISGVPEARMVWPGLTGKFHLRTAPPRRSYVEWDDVEGGSIRMYLAKDVTPSIMHHELGHVAAILAYPDLASAACDEAHEAAAMLFEQAVAFHSNDKVLWEAWGARQLLYPDAVSARVLNYSTLPLPEAVARVLSDGAE